ncbi:phosphoribosylanthranilate isomerase [Baekduia soli]|uniref:phosphoribosylanthranilate isomerase n=1 Tax=Baekduia soli TaxID=496014 RepID=UPI001E4BD66C|nr:phosphoribosylanthranilate isomerase [Baekduia soli]
MAHRAPRIKFCGITRLDDAHAAADAGAWALGLILWPGSKRACDPAEGARIAAQLRRRTEIAGVFVNQPLDDIAALADTIGLSLVQLHGDEGPSFCAEVARRTGAKVIKAAAVRGRADITAIQAFRTDFHLLDTHREGLRGGTGETFDWSLLSSRYSKVPLILSGGLDPANVTEAIETVRPWAVDVASGVESAPGVKDHDALLAFAAAVKATDEQPPVRAVPPRPDARGVAR